MAYDNLIQRFLQIQSSELLKSTEFPFEMVEISLKFLAANDMPIQTSRDEYVRLIVSKLQDLCAK
jgi:hypothetical protein